MWDATFRRLAERYNAPLVAPARTYRWRIDIPDDPQFLAAFCELIEQIGIPDVWRERDDSLTQLEAATIWNRAYLTLRKDDTMLGAIFPIATADIPEHMLLCDGATYNASDYPELFAAINPMLQLSGTQFKTPDLRGRFILADGNVDYPEYSIGGEYKHALTQSELAFHQHTTDPHVHSYTGDSLATVPSGADPLIPASFVSPFPSFTGDSGYLTDNGAGGDEPHENMPPYYVLRYAMFAKVG